ncbi:DUF2062 domain-containing protein [Chelativorans sp. AA-79]|uniref:DUF2062 domain-containing protein n=1 Tax=Chelativorans sp. AA-79 TaxID=3028735 RepID=UPI0023F74A8C|nr:DUF2062 domain-containing protein [Chelativorans sp. AA-79]WEX07672.1 DUF2062 domain-containing protein [Chelativorans sp. AA-79]
MLFKRRTKETLGERLKTAFWPRRSLQRSVAYLVKRTLRLSATPHAIAAGIAAGVFASFTPFMGFHFLIAAALAWILRGNLVASAFGTFIGNPLTFPFIWGATLGLGKFILRGEHPSSIGPKDVGHLLWHLEFEKLWEPLLKPMAIGSLPLGIVAALVLYVLTRGAAAAFHEERRKRLAERARRRAAAQAGAMAS